jgi:hypothetical protein
MAVERRLREVIDLLQKATELGRLRWEKTPDPMEFQGQFQGGSVRIRVENLFSPPAVAGQAVTIIAGKGGSSAGGFELSGSGFAGSAALSSWPVSLILLEPNGQTIEEWHPTNPDDVNAIEELFRVARRAALNIDAKLTSYLDRLRALTEMQPK